MSAPAFNPELIVEVCSVCDRACKGCYAPNVVNSRSKFEVYQQSPELFLSPADLQSRLEALPKLPRVVSLRGGEPTRHPELSQLIHIARSVVAGEIYLETHGRWLLKDDEQELARALSETKTIVKISFDKMHQISPASLQAMTDKLERAGIEFRIAITEVDQSAMLATRQLCPWLQDHIFIFQKKALRLSELPQPKLGVIASSGVRVNSLNVREPFRATL